MIEKKTDQELKKEIKSNRVNGIIYGILCVIFTLIFSINALLIVNKHPIYSVITFGFYTVILEIMELDKNLDYIYKRINKRSWFYEPNEYA